MKLAYHDGRLFAILAFVLCISATLLILLGDVLTGAAAFATKHWLTLVVLFGTILFGHIAKKAGWLNLKKYGFWILFWLGTVLIAYSSIGRQSETMTISAEQAKLDFAKRDRADKEIGANQTMLNAARTEYTKLDCAKVPYRRRCRAISRTVDVYTAAIAGNQAILDKLGPAKPVAPDADKLAEVLGVFGYDEKRTRALAVLLQPIGYFAFLEYGSILSLGFVLSGGQRKSRRAGVPTASNSDQSAPSGSLHMHSPTATKINIETRDIADKPILIPVSVKDNMQSSFPAATAEVVALFKSPNRWTYQRDLS